MTKTRYFRDELTGLELKVVFSVDGETKKVENIRITDSYQCRNNKVKVGILEAINNFITEKGWSFNRNTKSMLREWKALNVLYRMKYKREQTRTADIDANEKKKRKFSYFFLSLFE